jgi:hypothetical protein
VPVWIDHLNEAQDFSKEKYMSKLESVASSEVCSGFMLYGLQNLDDTFTPNEIE